MKKFTKFLNEETKALNANNSESAITIDENQVPTIEVSCDDAIIMLAYSIKHILSFSSEKQPEKEQPKAIQGEVKKEQPKAIQGEVKKEQPAIQGEVKKEQPAIQGNTTQQKALPQNNTAIKKATQ